MACFGGTWVSQGAKQLRMTLNQDFAGPRWSIWHIGWHTMCHLNGISGYDGSASVYPTSGPGSDGKYDWAITNHDNPFGDVVKVVCFTYE